MPGPLIDLDGGPRFAVYKLFKESLRNTNNFLGPLLTNSAEFVKQSSGRYAALSEREREAIRLVNEGLMNNQIAERLGLSERTVESHRFHAYQKIGISTAKELRQFLEEVITQLN